MTLSALITLAFMTVVCSWRSAPSDARTPSEVWAVLRRAGWGRCTVTAVRAGAVLILLLLVEVCRMCWQGAALAGGLLTIIAAGIEHLAARRAPVEGTP